MESNKIKDDQTLLSIDDIYVSYGEIPVLRGVSINIKKGQILGIVGESGSGKSTAIYTVLGILGNSGQISRGKINYSGMELLSLSKEEMRKLRGKELALIAQNPVESFHPIRKIKSQLKELVRSHGGVSYEEAEERMLKLLWNMRLENGKNLLDSYAFELSGGMCQRVSIAMAMCLRPDILFADEPTSALDVTVQAQVVEELMQLRDTYQTSIMIVSHNMGVIAHMSDLIVVMYAGLVLESGTPEKILGDAKHPYTKNLIHAIPRLHAPTAKGIRTCIQDRTAPGCPYCECCFDCTDICRNIMPSLYHVDTMHQVRCHRMSGEKKL